MFRPLKPRILRELTRYRAELVQAQNKVDNRIQKLLERCNIKLSSVASDTLGASGRLMMEAIIAGEDNPERLADLAKQRLREKIPALRLALAGKVCEHHRFLLRELLDERKAKRPTAASPSLHRHLSQRSRPRIRSATQISERNKANSKPEPGSLQTSMVITTSTLTHLRNPEIRPPPLDDVNNLQA